MSGKIEISRGLLERIAGLHPNYTCAQLEADEEELRALLAAPVVECQETVAYIVEAIDPNNGHLRRRGLHWHSVETLRGTRDFKEWIGENLTKEQPLYTSPPAPIAVVLPERLKLTAQKDLADPVTFDWQRGWNACLDKVKEMNVYDEEQKCTECMQYGKVNHRGVCEFCEDPYGISALMELVELEEAILRSQE